MVDASCHDSQPEHERSSLISMFIGGNDSFEHAVQALQDDYRCRLAAERACIDAPKRELAHVKQLLLAVLAHSRQGRDPMAILEDAPQSLDTPAGRAAEFVRDILAQIRTLPETLPPSTVDVDVDNWRAEVVVCRRQVMALETALDARTQELALLGAQYNYELAQLRDELVRARVKLTDQQVEVMLHRVCETKRGRRGIEWARGLEG